MFAPLKAATAPAPSARRVRGQGGAVSVALRHRRRGLCQTEDALVICTALEADDRVDIVRTKNRGRRLSRLSGYFDERRREGRERVAPKELHHLMPIKESSAAPKPPLPGSGRFSSGQFRRGGSEMLCGFQLTSERWRARTTCSGSRRSCSRSLRVAHVDSGVRASSRSGSILMEKSARLVRRARRRARHCLSLGSVPDLGDAAKTRERSARPDLRARAR